MRRHSSAIKATGTVLAVALSGCSGAERPSTSAAGGDGRSGGAERPRSALAAVTASTRRLEASGTFTSSFSQKVTTGKKATTVTRGRTRNRVKPELAQDGTYTGREWLYGKKGPGIRWRAILLHDVEYTWRAGGMGEGKPWEKVSWADLRRKTGIDRRAAEPSEQLDPLVNLRMLPTSKDVRRVGGEPVSGVPATRYKGTYDMRQRLARLDPKTREAAEYLGAQGMQVVEFDLWVDDRGMPRKLVYAGVTSLPFVGRGEATTTVRFDDFGEPVKIVAPPASQTRDRTRETGPVGGGAGG